MSEWTPEALAAEAERRAEAESRGLCPDSGYTIARCWSTDLCDCAWSPPSRCRVCKTVVWDLPDHNKRHHSPEGANHEGHQDPA